MDSSPPDDDFLRLLLCVRNGDEDACRQLVERYSSTIRRVVRRYLDTRVRPLVDSLDLTQSIWRSWFARVVGYDLHNSEQLIAALRVMARNKAVEANRRYLRCQKRDVRRVVPLDGRDITETDPPVSREPSAHEVLIARETRECLAYGLNPVQELMLTLLQYGFTHQEIAEVMKLSEKTVQRFLDRVETRLKEEHS